MAESQAKAGLGMLVEIELLSRSGENERMAFVIVPEQSADYTRGFLSESTPLAKVLIGHTQGETLAYVMDELYAVRLLNVTQNPDTPLTDLAAERQAKYSQAVRDAEHAHAVTFAASFSGKWGDYDPDSLPKDNI